MSRDLPLILFDTYNVFKEAAPLTSGLHPEHVAAVLDVVVRHARNEPVQTQVPDAGRLMRELRDIRDMDMPAHDAWILNDEQRTTMTWAIDVISTFAAAQKGE